MKRLINCLALMCCFCMLNAQQPANTPNPPAQFSLDNPRAAASTHLDFLNKRQPVWAAKTIYAPELSEKKRIQLAIQLKQIYDGDGYYVHYEDIPNDSAYVDSTTGKARFIVYPKYPEIYLQKYGDQWLYSAKTVAVIPNIHKQIFPFGTDWLVQLTPAIGYKRFLGLNVWQWEGILLLILLGVAVYYLFGWIFSFMMNRVLPIVFPKHKEHLNQKLIHRVASPLSLLIVFWVLSFFFPVIQLSVSVGRYVSLFLRLATLMLGVATVYRLVDLLADIFGRLTQRTETSMDDQLVPLVRRIAKIVVVVIGIIFVLQNLNIEVTALLAGVSIGGLALALAAQDTVRNFIGSLSIFVDRPFQIGDFIETSGITGSVAEVGVRSTRVIAADGALISVPNGDLANYTVTNHSVRTYRRYNTTIGLTYDTTADQIESFVKQLRELVKEHPKTKAEGNLIYFHEMADSSLNIHFMVYFENASYEDMLAARQDLFLQIMRLAEQMGISFAFPSTSVYVETMPKGEERN